MKNPCESTLVMNLVEACRRELEKPKTKKEPISPEHLASPKDFGHRKASLKDIRLLAICMLGYAGFFRQRIMQYQTIRYNILPYVHQGLHTKEQDRFL